MFYFSITCLTYLPIFYTDSFQTHNKGAYLMKKQDTSGQTDYLSAYSGTIDYPLMNDYMFRSVMQSNKNVLKGLLCSLLHLQPEDILSVEILNPIELGKTIQDKDFFLDIKILMNDSTVVNLEMQVHNEYNWSERSLVYLCRLFDNLNSGMDYGQVKPAFQIGILNFTPIPERPEFYSTYKLMNEKNYHKYSDKFTLHVLNLTQIHLATDEDKAYRLDSWAKLFRATTWEDFKMIAANNKNMQEAGETLYHLSKEDHIRYLCEAREDYRRTWNGVKRQMAEYQAAITEKDSIIAEKDSAIAEKDFAIARLEAQIAELQKQADSSQE